MVVVIVVVVIVVVVIVVVVIVVVVIVVVVIVVVVIVVVASRFTRGPGLVEALIAGGLHGADRRRGVLGRRVQLGIVLDAGRHGDHCMARGQGFGRARDRPVDTEARATTLPGQV